MNPIPPLITQLENPADLNLDEVLIALRDASHAFDDLRVRANHAEEELQRELKAMIELAGPISTCLEPLDAFQLHGEDLIKARRSARKQYNEVFHLTPIRK